MPLPRREPFFLKGRTSVVQRAVMMSLVLGGLACVAAFLLATVSQHTFDMNDAFSTADIAWGILVGAILFAPLNYWNCRSVILTISAAMTGVLFQAHIASTVEQLVDPYEPMTSSSVLLHTTEYVAIVCTSYQVYSGLLLIRFTRIHVAAFVVAITASILPATYILLCDSVEAYRALMATGIPMWLVNSLYDTWNYAANLCTMFIPWGIPFWWPPEKDG